MRVECCKSEKCIKIHGVKPVERKKRRRREWGALNRQFSKNREVI